jgi:hypothetical protein
LAWLFYCFLFIAASISIAYFASPASSTRKQVRKAFAPFESINSEVHAQEDSLRKSISCAANSYIEEICRERLQNIPIEKLRGSGLRLQVIRDAGITNLADLQGWSESRLLKLHGVGPKTALKIKGAVKKTLNEFASRPIAHPVPPFNSARGCALTGEIYRQRSFSSNIKPKEKDFQALLHSFRERKSNVFRKVNFGHWLLSFGQSESLKTGIVEGNLLCTDLDVCVAISPILKRISQSLDEFRSLFSNGKDPQLFTNDYNKNLTFYRQALLAALGPRSEATEHRTPAAVSEPRVSSVKSTTLAVSTALPTTPQAPAFQFDPQRRAELKAESIKLSALLSRVFADPTTEVATVSIAEAGRGTGATPLLSGLDADHSELLRTILQQAQWTRPEFEAVCAGSGLMPDGAIERINTASFNQFDCPLIEGEDLIDVNRDLMTKELA